MNYTQEDIKRKAFRIWQEKERNSIPSTPEENWKEAEEILELKDTIQRG